MLNSQKRFVEISDRPLDNSKGTKCLLAAFEIVAFAFKVDSDPASRHVPHPKAGLFSIGHLAGGESAPTGTVAPLLLSIGAFDELTAEKAPR